MRTALAALVLAGAAMPQAAWANPAPTAPDIAALCPVGGPAGLAFGVERKGQDAAALRALEGDGPLGEGEAQFTTWSDQLYAVEWRKPSPDDAINQPWRENVDAALLAAGWRPVDHRKLKSSSAMDQTMVEKTVGNRTLVIEYDTSGIQMLRCGDLALMEIDARERDGDLLPGSPRPVPPAAPVAPFTLPDPAICARPDLVAAFSSTKSSREIGPLLERHFDLRDPVGDQEEFENRLKTWLEWKLRTAGGLSMEQIWNLTEPPPGVDELEESLGSINLMIEAEAAKDGRKLCQAGLAMFGSLQRDMAQRAAANHRINAALDGELRRLKLD